MEMNCIKHNSSQYYDTEIMRQIVLLLFLFTIIIINHELQLTAQVLIINPYALTSNVIVSKKETKHGQLT